MRKLLLGCFIAGVVSSLFPRICKGETLVSAQNRSRETVVCRRINGGSVIEAITLDSHEEGKYELEWVIPALESGWDIGDVELLPNRLEFTWTNQASEKAFKRVLVITGNGSECGRRLLCICVGPADARQTIKEILLLRGRPDNASIELKFVGDSGDVSLCAQYSGPE